MRYATLLLAALLPSCQERVLDERNTVVVTAVDPDGLPVPGAIVWTLSGALWDIRRWLPSELLPYYGNPHELVRRLGVRHVLGADAALRVPRGTLLAGEVGALAGMTTIDESSGERDKLLLAPWRWTIIVRDEDGAPVAGVPVGCAPEEVAPTGQFEGVSLGLTDAQGQLVVCDPASVRVESFLPSPSDGREPEAPSFTFFEVEGMYLRPHAARLPSHGGESGTVILKMPPVTKIEVRVPEWGGPLVEWVTMTRTGKGMEWDGALCWPASSGRYYGLVGAPARSSTTPIVVEVPGAAIRTPVNVPRMPAGETFPIAVALAEGDVVVRARLRDADGRVVRFARLRTTPAIESLRTPFIHADSDGRIALVFDAAAAVSVRIALEVESGPDVELVGARAELQIEDLVRGERRDVGGLLVSRGGG